MSQYRDRNTQDLHVRSQEGALDTHNSPTPIQPGAQGMGRTGAIDDERLSLDGERSARTLLVSATLVTPSEEGSSISLPDAPQRLPDIALATPAQVIQMSVMKRVLAALFLVMFGLFALIFGIMFGLINQEPPLPIKTTATTTVPSITETPTTTIAPSDSTEVFVDTVCTRLPNSCPDLLDSSSPQRRALAWLMSNPNFLFYTEDQKIQRFALATLHYSIKFKVGLVSTAWMNKSIDVCDWDTEGNDRLPSIDCTSSRRVRNIYLSHQINSGTIPRELSLLSGSLGESVVKTSVLLGQADEKKYVYNQSVLK